MDNTQHFMPPSQQTPRKKWPFIIIGIAAFLIAIGGTILALATFGPDIDKDESSTVASAKGLAPQTLIEKVATNKIVTDSQNYTLYRGSDAQNAASPIIDPVIFAVADYSYLVSVNTTTSLRFTVNTDKTASDKDAIKNAIQTTLIDNDFAKTTQDTKVFTPHAYTTFDSEESVCQLIDYDKVETTNLTLSLVCLSKNDLKAAYADVTKRLQTTGTDVLSTATTISQKTSIDAGKKLITLSVRSKDKNGTTQYHFATLDAANDSGWQYVGSRPTPSVDDKDSFVVSETLTSAITDPKWGTFLTDNIK